MQGGVFGWVSDSSRFVRALKSAFNDQIQKGNKI
jgi:hypothetical protein